MNISVKNALTLISSTLSLHSQEHILPYFFIAGAGISAPEIPLSSNIIDLCKDEVRTRNPDYYSSCAEKMKPHEGNPFKNYSGWIELAYPNSIDRSKFFKGIITKAKISSANLMLAHILYSKKIATTVFTTNFDDKLKQALELIGVTDLFVAENAMDNLVINPQNSDIQIVHVHGTYNFYDCANLEHEICAVANQTNTVSSSRVLSNFLSNQAPIIVGYSGWENDVIMTCLRERLSYPTPLKYLWICYSRKSYESLPEWLKKSESMNFVLPEIEDVKCEDEIISNQFFPKSSGNRVDRLDATRFFNLLISSIKLDVPLIFENPFLYYSQRINSVLPQHEDVLHLRHWADRMKYLGASESAFDTLLKKMEHADVMNDLASASSILKEITKLDLQVSDLRFTSEILLSSILEKENILETFESTVNFRFSVLDFIETHYEMLLSEGILSQLLDDLLLWKHCKEADCDLCARLQDRIYSVAKKDISTLGIALTCLGQKASMLNDKSEQEALLQEIIKRGHEYLNDSRVHYVYCVALYNLAELIPENDSIALIKEADGEIKKAKSLRLQVTSLVAKSKILHRLSSIDQKTQWIRDIIEWISQKGEHLDYTDAIQIASNIAKESKDLLLNIDGTLDFLRSTYENNKSANFSNCEPASQMAELSVCLSGLTDSLNQQNMYYNDLKLFREKIPLDCKKMEQLQGYALLSYCEKPISLIPDQLKIDEIIKFKNTFPDEPGWIDAFLRTAIAIGDLTIYKSCRELQEDILHSQKSSDLSSAIESYSAKKYQDAEGQFMQLINCGFPDLEMRARNNLSFMIRRKETVNIKESFWEILSTVPDSFAFKQMNIALYCIAEKMTDDKRFLTAMSYLQEASNQDREELLQCWEDINFVGERESELALHIIEGKYHLNSFE